MKPEQLAEIKQSAELCTLTRDEIIAISNLAFAVICYKQNVGLRMIDLADSARKIIEQKRPGKDCIANLLAHVEDQDRRLKELEVVLAAERETIARFLIAHRDTPRGWIEAFEKCGSIKANWNYHPLYPYISANPINQPPAEQKGAVE